MGTMKGVGRIYQQTFIDTYSRVALAKLYTEKTAITAADMLNDQVIPFFDEQGIPLLTPCATFSRPILRSVSEVCREPDSRKQQPLCDSGFFVSS